MKKSFLSFAILTSGLLGSSGSLFAAAGTWQGGAAGDWDTIANWTGASVPTTGELGTFNQSVTTTVTLDAPAQANIQQRGTGNVEIVGSGANVFTLSGGTSIAFGASAGGIQTSANLTVSGPLTVDSFTVNQVDAEDTAGILEFAGAMTNVGGVVKTATIAGRFDGAIRFSNGFAAGTGGLRVTFNTNGTNNESKYLDLNTNTVALDRVNLNTAGGASGSVVIRAIGSERTLTGSSTVGTFALGSVNAAGLEFGGSNNLNIGTAGTNVNAIGFNNQVPTGGNFTLSQTNSGKTDLNGNVVLSSVTNAGITLLTIDGAGAGEFEAGAIQQGNAAASSVVINRAANSITRFTGANTYTGTTTVSAGTLLINGTTSGSSGAYAINGGALGGTGTITTGNANVTFADGAALTPGDSSAANLTLALGSGVLDVSSMATADKFIFSLDAVASSDKVSITTGTLNIGTLNSSEFEFTLGGGFAGPDTYTLFDTANTITFAALDTAVFAINGSYNGQLQFANSTQDIQLVVTAVPEPTSWVLLAGGLTILTVLRRRRVA